MSSKAYTLQAFMHAYGTALVKLRKFNGSARSSFVLWLAALQKLEEDEQAPAMRHDVRQRRKIIEESIPTIV